MMGRPVRPATCGQIPPAMQKGPSFPSPLASLDVCTSRGSPQLDQVTGAAQQVKDRDMSELIERINAEIAHQRQTRGDILDYGTPDPLLVESAATIAQLQAELAEAREVPGRIAEYLRDPHTVMDNMALWIGKTKAGFMTSRTKGDLGIAAWFARNAATAIEARDWSKK